MSASIDGGEMLKQKEIKELSNDYSSFIALAEKNESEIKWVKLHQMFDR